MDRRNAYYGAVRAFSVAFVAIGLLLLIVTFANGGGPLGVVLGLAFIAVGALRFWLAGRSRR